MGDLHLNIRSTKCRIIFLCVFYFKFSFHYVSNLYYVSYAVILYSLVLVFAPPKDLSEFPKFHSKQWRLYDSNKATTSFFRFSWNGAVYEIQLFI